MEESLSQSYLIQTSRTIPYSHLTLQLTGTFRHPEPYKWLPHSPSKHIFYKTQEGLPAALVDTVPAVCRTTWGWHELQTMSSRQPQPQRSFSEEDKKCRLIASKLPST